MIETTNPPSITSYTSIWTKFFMTLAMLIAGILVGTTKIITGLLIAEAIPELGQIILVVMLIVGASFVGLAYVTGLFISFIHYGISMLIYAHKYDQLI